MTSPTQRTLAELKRRGWVYHVVEKWNPFAKRRVDMFGVIDIVAISQGLGLEHGDPSLIIGIQCTSGTNHSARIAKIKAEPRAKAWMEAGGKVQVWSWSRKGKRGKRKTWQLRVEEVT